MDGHSDSVGWRARAVRAAAAGVLAAALVSAARAQDVELLPQRYTDKLHGFSLRPPAQSEQLREALGTTLVRWVGMDPKTRTVAWTIGVNVVAAKDANEDLKRYAQAVTAQLKLHDGMELESTEEIQVAGRGAVDIRGLMPGGNKADTRAAAPDKNRWWRRQVWVLAQPGRFVVFWITGPADAKDRLSRGLQSILDTVKLTDPLEALAAQEKALAAGRALLAQIRTRKIVPAEGPAWLLVSVEGRPVGWSLQVESAGTQEGTLQIQTWTMMKIPNDQLRLQKRSMSASPSASVESWKETLQVGEGKDRAVIEEDGVRGPDLVTCTITQGSRLRTRKKPVPRDPNEPREMYLSRTVGLVLPRLLDLSKPAAYSFATYSSLSNDYELRTLSVIGPETILLGGRSVAAVHLTDVVGADDEMASHWYVDAKGNTLRLQSPGGLTVDASTRQEVLSKLPESKPFIEEASPE